MQVPVQHDQYLVGTSVAPGAVDDAEPVAVAVKGDAKLVAARDDAVAQLAQSLDGGRRQIAAEMRIARIVDHVHRAAGGAENNQQRVGAGAEHGIEQHPRAVLPDGGQIHDGQNVINKGVEGVLLPENQPGRLRVLKGISRTSSGRTAAISCSSRAVVSTGASRPSSTISLTPL